MTGANSGIGQAVAIALGEAGADVVVNYVDDEAADAVVDKIREFDANAYPHKTDVSSEDGVAAMFKRMTLQFGTIDILVTMPACNGTRSSGT